MDTGSALLSRGVTRTPQRPTAESEPLEGGSCTEAAISLSLSPPGFVEPLDLHTCYTPWPVFRDVTDGTGLYAKSRRCSAAKGSEVETQLAKAPTPGTWASARTSRSGQRRLVAEDHTGQACFCVTGREHKEQHPETAVWFTRVQVRDTRDGTASRLAQVPSRITTPIRAANRAELTNRPIIVQDPWVTSQRALAGNLCHAVPAYRVTSRPRR